MLAGRGFDTIPDKRTICAVEKILNNFREIRIFTRNEILFFILLIVAGYSGIRDQSEAHDRTAIAVLSIRPFTCRKRNMQRSVCWLLIGVLIAIAATRIVTTYHVFNHTYDEPTHIHAGLRFLQTGDYSGYEETPPLARIFLAFGPVLYGAKALVAPSNAAALSVLYDSESYETVLTLARLGNIPFFILLVAGTGLWCLHLFGARAAVIASAVLTMLPPVLGHAGVATTDIACAATVLLALYAFLRWLETGSWRWAILLALSGGGAVMVKFSAIPYVGVSMVTIVLWRFVIFRETGAAWHHPRAIVAQLSVIAALAICIFWLSYGGTNPFHTEVIHDKFDKGSLQLAVARVVGKDTAAFAIVRAVLSEIHFPVFVRDMIFGLNQLSVHNERGHWNYLFGEMSHDGWWYYYVVGLFFKTPIPFLLLGVFASIDTIRRSASERDWRLAVPIICAAAILIFTSGFSRINTGVRHILIVYPFVAVAIGALVDRLWVDRRRASLALALLLLLWLTAGSVATHPDYLADFNAFAGDRPERILIDSDLDMGQDLKRLREAVVDRKIDRILVAFYGNADIHRHIPNAVELEVGQTATGWIAASRTALATRPGVAWLATRRPVARIGRSINLYYIDPEPSKDR
jgi:4-amino-4-deoxy-L-arabinose transferase-like glycosyltransferase